MITKLIGNDNFLPNVKCKTWEQLVDIAGKPLIDEGAVEPQFLDSIKETVERYGAYMILVDDIAFFHGRPEAGVVGVEREGRVAAQHQRLVERGLEGLDDAGVALAHFDDAT
ncbi:MAG: PTS sugar transporter subunit IIA, partial [Oscillospiraceae bacterium]